MRYVPLVSDRTDPATWAGCGDFDVNWTGAPHPAWAEGGLVHAVHFPAAAWNLDLVEGAVSALAARLRPDFLVFHAHRPEGRQATAHFFHSLQALLEATHPRGVKVALRPAPGAAESLAALLKEMRGEAVGYCWDEALGEGLEAVSDRLFCAVGGPGADLAPLLRLGYRWNFALEAADPGAFAEWKAAFEAQFDPVLFPAEPPTHALGRRVQPDEGVTFGKGLGGS